MAGRERDRKTTAPMSYGQGESATMMHEEKAIIPRTDDGLAVMKWTVSHAGCPRSAWTTDCSWGAMDEEVLARYNIRRSTEEVFKT